jgi:DNA-directed RNA polymerase subunit E'/Rpb7
MEASALYVRSLLKETILLKPHELGSNFEECVQAHLVATLEGRCSLHGFIRPKSIAVHSVTQGRVIAASLNGDIHADVEYYASVCNPAIGVILKSRVIKVNPRLGVMTHCMDVDEVTRDSLAVVECMVPKQVVVMPSEIPLEDLQEGQTVFVEVIKKRFERNDPKISVIGRAVSQQTLLKKSAAAAAAAAAAASTRVALVDPFAAFNGDMDAVMDADDGAADDADDASSAEDEESDKDEDASSGSSSSSVDENKESEKEDEDASSSVEENDDDDLMETDDTVVESEPK